MVNIGSEIYLQDRPYFDREISDLQGKFCRNFGKFSVKRDNDPKYRIIILIESSLD